MNNNAWQACYQKTYRFINKNHGRFRRVDFISGLLKWKDAKVFQLKPDAL